MSPQLASGIRAARPADEEPVVALLEAENLDPRFEADEFLVAEDEGEVVGCARLRLLDGERFELASVAVDPDRRGEGIGTTLVRRALDTASGTVQALCVEPRFFARLGFEPVDGVHPDLQAKAEGCCAGRDVELMAWRDG